MSRQSENPAIADGAPSCLDLGFAHFRGFTITICFLVMAGALGLNFVKQKVHHRLRDQITKTVNQQLKEAGYLCELEQAEWLEGRGLQLKGLSLKTAPITAGEKQQVIASIDQMFVKSPFKLTDLLNGKPQIESVQISGAEILCRQDSNEIWELQHLMSQLELPKDICEFPIQVRDSSLTIRSPAILNGSDVSIHGISLDRKLVAGESDERREVESIVGHLSTEVTARLDFKANIDRGQGYWQASVSANEVEIDESLVNLIGGLVGLQKPLESTRGQIQLTADAVGYLDGSQIPNFQVAGVAQNVQCLDPSMPHRIHGGSFRFQANNNEARISDASFRVGYGKAGGQLVVTDLMNQRDWHLSGWTREFKLTERLLSWFPAELKQAWHSFHPTGIVDANFDLKSEDGKISKQIYSNVRDASVSWYRFPFRLSSCSGKINWIENVLTMEVNAVEAQQTIDVRARIVDPGENWSGWLTGNCDGDIPINEKILQAFDVKPGLARALRKFNSNGHVSGDGRIERQPGSPNVHKKFNIELKQATVRHENFDYPFYNVNGQVIVENDKTRFQNIRGFNNNGEVECNGFWNPVDGLSLRFLARTVLLDDELKYALPERFLQLWRNLRPNGIVDLVGFDLRWKEGMPVQMDFEGEVFPSTVTRVSNVTINPVWFPYELRQVTGKIRYADEQIVIQDFTAQHDGTSISGNGKGSRDDTSWRLRLSDVFATGIVLDDALKSAMPKSLSRGLDRIQFDGQLSMRGVLEFAGNSIETGVNQSNNGVQSTNVSTNSPRTPSANMGWNVEFSLGQAKAKVGVPITHANGSMKLVGQMQQGKVKCNGTLAIDSMMYRDMQITSVVAPISIDNNLIGLGSLADTGNAKNPASSATARAFSGYIQCDAQVQLAGDNDYFFQAELSDGDLGELACETSMQNHDMTGKAFGGIRLYGNATGSHSIRGKGQVEIRDAKIYEFPIMIALLNVLRIREPDRTAFDRGQMEFSVNGENIDFEKIELNGNTISLIGRGTVNMDKELDLDFYSMMGRNRFSIPVLTQLYKAGSQQVWWIEVGGSISNPVTEHQVLPGLNDSLKSLFPELVEDSNK